MSQVNAVTASQLGMKKARDKVFNHSHLTMAKEIEPTQTCTEDTLQDPVRINIQFHLLDCGLIHIQFL